MKSIFVLCAIFVLVACCSSSPVAKKVSTIDEKHYLTLGEIIVVQSREQGAGAINTHGMKYMKLHSRCISKKYFIFVNSE